MTYIVTDRCIDSRYTECVADCPVDCFYELQDPHMLIVNPEECIDCDACVPLCPVNAIYPEAEVPDEVQGYAIDRGLVAPNESREGLLVAFKGLRYQCCIVNLIHALPCERTMETQNCRKVTPLKRAIFVIGWEHRRLDRIPLFGKLVLSGRRSCTGPYDLRSPVKRAWSFSKNWEIS